MNEGSEQPTTLFWSALLSLLLVAVFLTPLRSTDLWWHLDSGRWMLQHGQYLGQEVRSFTIPGELWPNFSWLFQVVIAAVESVAGLWGLLFLKAAICWLILLLLFRSTPVQQVPVALLLAVLVISWRVFPYLYLRPHLFEGLFLATAVFLFHQARTKHDPFWYGLLILLWANFHSSAVVGAAALSLHYIVGSEYKIPPAKTLLRRLPLGLLWWPLLFVTPNGFDILDVLQRHAQGDFLHVYIREWFAPDFLHPLMFIALIASVTVAIVKRGVLSPAEAMLILLFLLLSNNSRRFQFELALLLIRPTAIIVGMWINWFVARCGLSGYYWNWLYGLILTVLLIVVYPPPLHWTKQDMLDYPIQQMRYPHVAMAVLQPVLDNEAELRVLNDYGWGGYLGWKGKGRLKIYIDGRTPTVFSEELMLNLILAEHKPQLLRSLAQRYDVGAIVIRRGTSLPIKPGDPVWKLVAFDRISMLYLRADLAQRYQLEGMGFDPLRNWPRVDVQQVEQVVRRLRQLLAFDENNDLAWLRLGQLLGFFKPQGGVQNQVEALQALQRAIDQNAEDIYARLSLAYLRQQAGEDHQSVAQPILSLLENSGFKGVSGHEVVVATLLLKTGYYQQVVDVLTPQSWARHQQLDEDINVWLLRLAAHTRLGDVESAAFDRHIAQQLARDAGPKAWERLRAVEQSLD